MKSPVRNAWEFHATGPNYSSVSHADFFGMATVDEDWVDGQLQRLGVDAAASSIETLQSFPFKPRSVAYDGERFWTADRNNHAIVLFTLVIS